MNLKKPQSRAYQPHTTRSQSDVLLCAAAHCLREVPAHMVCPEDSHRTPPCRPRPSMLKLCWIHKIAFYFVFCVFKISIWDFCAKSIFDFCWILPSLPLRGAWIEIAWSHPTTRCPIVAPLAGSVDRNKDYLAKRLIMKGSLPLRGAWIEITARP